MTDVVLVSMPFGALTYPSIGLSLLKAGLQRQGQDSRVLYFSLKFAEMIGEPLYSQLSRDGKPSIRELVGEWIFSRDLFGSSDEEEAAYIEEILRQRKAWEDPEWPKPISETLINRILSARRRVAPFLEWCVDRVLAENPRIVGFTSVFQQNVASLALARRLKARKPDLFTIFGGANCEGAMGAEMVRQFDFVDATVSGEADVVFPGTVRQVLAGEVVNAPGVRTKRTVHENFEQAAASTSTPVPHMDDLPYPDYADFFEQFGKTRFAKIWQPGLFYETSRGCWWGEKQHCTFCGLNGATMAFRSKSAGRALQELLSLVEAHPGCDIQVVDNILDMKYLDDFVPELARRKLDLVLFYETKSNLRKEQIRLLAAANIRQLQPGVESLSDAVLKLMRKGVSGLQNIQLLKWCKEHGVTPHWNYLFGFPGEPAEEYSRLAALSERLDHLRPPSGSAGIRLDRFSPNFNESARHGFANVRPLAPYRHIYRVPDAALHNLAYYFSYDYAKPQDTRTYVAPLLKSIRTWQRSHKTSELALARAGKQAVMIDLRRKARRPFKVLDPMDRAICEACDGITDARRIASALQEKGMPIESGALLRRLAALVDDAYLLRDGERYIGLAVPLGDYELPAHSVGRLVSAAQRLGRRTKGRITIPVEALDKRCTISKEPSVRVAKHVRPTFSIEKRGDLVVHLGAAER